MSIRVVIRFAYLATTAALLSACLGSSSSSVAPALRTLPPDTQVLLAKQGMRAEAPIFVRIFKEESQLEIWKVKDDGRFYLLKTYPICAWSGALGPKVTHGDKQAPEGFYTVTPGQLNPNSKFYLAFNLGYPNAFDRANGHTGDALMIHGDCRSAGCYAMTDALIEEIYILGREALQGGQREFPVHAFPFRMTTENMMRHRGDKWYSFWRTMKEGYDAFEMTRIPPKINVCSRNYLVNANFLGHETAVDPLGQCPAYRKQAPDPFDPFRPGTQQVAANKSRPTSVPATPPAPTQNTRVAAFTPSVGQAAVAQARTAQTVTPQAFPQPVVQQPQQRPQPVRAAAASPQHPQQQPATRNAHPAQIMQHQAQPPVQAPVLAGATPVRSAQQKPAQLDDPAAADTPKPEVTQGIHNVVVSGKGDMIPMPRTAPQQ